MCPQLFSNVIVIDQDPIGRTPRSNPATYTKLFDEIRKIFASTKEAKARGYKEGRFSFNVKGGRCETCQGDGVLRIEMNFLARRLRSMQRLQRQTLQQRNPKRALQGQKHRRSPRHDCGGSSQILREHTTDFPQTSNVLDVGLGYIKLGQSSTTYRAEKASVSKSPANSAKTK